VSLLNSALRAAEERQNQPRPAGAYIGQRANERRGRGWLVMLVLTVLALTLAAGAWWWFAGASRRLVVVCRRQAHGCRQPGTGAGSGTRSRTPAGNGGCISSARTVVSARTRTGARARATKPAGTRHRNRAGECVGGAGTHTGAGYPAASSARSKKN